MKGCIFQLAEKQNKQCSLDLALLLPVKLNQWAKRTKKKEKAQKKYSRVQPLPSGTQGTDSSLAQVLPYTSPNSWTRSLKANLKVRTSQQQKWPALLSLDRRQISFSRTVLQGLGTGEWLLPVEKNSSYCLSVTTRIFLIKSTWWKTYMKDSSELSLYHYNKNKLKRYIWQCYLRLSDFWKAKSKLFHEGFKTRPGFITVSKTVSRSLRSASGKYSLSSGWHQPPWLL